MNNGSPGKGFKMRQEIKKAISNPGTFRHSFWGEDRESHHLIIKKIAPQSVQELAKRLQQPQHRDIHNEAIKQQTFADCLGTIAAMLDIALDGIYDVPDLAELLCQAMDKRGTLGNSPHLLNRNLVNVELIEREKSMELVEAGGTIAPLPQTDVQRFMREHGCKVCENTAACKLAGKCLGEDALDAEVPDVA